MSSASPTAQVGIIGGSGLYQIEALDSPHEIAISTPFGEPSDSIVVGELTGMRVAFLPRHGKGHRLSPTEINVRANIYALKSLGVERIISISAVGSMSESIAPLDLVIPDQIVDRTFARARTFFEDGIVAHVGIANPYCPQLSQHLYDAANGEAPAVHQGGTYVCIEGPQFSTRAESRVYRQWGVDVIGMTAMPEARLAREAEICYATLALVTDYDVWHDTAESVTVEQVLSNLNQNTVAAKSTLRRVLTSLPAGRTCNCGSALANSIVTEVSRIPPEAIQRLGPLVEKYLT